MRPLVITDEVRAAVAEVCAWADAHRINHQTMVKMVESMAPLGDHPNSQIVIPVGFRCAYTVEEQPPPMGWCRHLSVSVDRPGKLPSPEAMAQIVPLFGFSRSFAEWLGGSWEDRPPIDGTFVYLEAGRAINVMERL